MIFADKEISELLKKLPENVTADYLQEIVKPFPYPTTYDVVAGPLIDVLKKENGQASVDDARKEIVAAIQAKYPNNGNKNGDSKAITRAYFDHLLIEQRLLGTVQPDLHTEFFNQVFDTPVMTAALSHLNNMAGSFDGMVEYAYGAKLTNALHWVGMCENDEFEEIMKVGAKTVRIIKPYKGDEKIFGQLECAKKSGATAVGMDIDHVFTLNGGIDAPRGQEMEPKTLKQIKSYIDYTNLPFIIKGVLSVSDALKAKELGAAGIVISHHGGRIGFAVPPLYVLPDIAKAVKGSMKIFVDCGVQYGLDAYKALALGADGVGIGTHLLSVLVKGREGIAASLNLMSNELRGAMAFTGVKDTKSFDPTVIHVKDW